jgi:hypothetical protein
MKNEITQRDKIARMAVQREDGASIRMLSELDGMPATSAQRHICVMVQDGRLFKASRAGCRARWFTTEASVRLWEQQPAMDPSEWVAPGIKAWANSTRPRAVEKVKKQAAINVATPKHVGVAPGVVIADVVWVEADNSKAKVIACPTPTSYSRTYVDPKTRIEGGFATMGIARYES